MNSTPQQAQNVSTPAAAATVAAVRRRDAQKPLARRVAADTLVIRQLGRMFAVPERLSRRVALFRGHQMLECTDFAKRDCPACHQ